MKYYFNSLRQQPLGLSVAMCIAPLFFLIFFTRQAYYVHSYDLSVWKGGGMGMFSSPDHPSKRHIYLYTINTAGVKKLVIPEFYNYLDVYDDLKTLPHPELIQDAQEAFFTTPLYVRKESATTIWLTDYPSTPGMTRFSPRNLRIELWKMDQIDGRENTTAINLRNVWEMQQ